MDRNTEECDQELMKKWKTRLKIWSDGEKMTMDTDIVWVPTR